MMGQMAVGMLMFIFSLAFGIWGFIFTIMVVTRLGRIVNILEREALKKT